MSTVISKRRPNKLDPAVKANSLIRYTLEITSNDKVFKPCYRALTDDIIRYTEDIFTKIWTAYNIRVNSLEDAKWRCKLQTDAYLLCDKVLSLINIGYSIYHLRGKRVMYWTSLILDTKESIGKWRNNEIKKYNINSR